MKKRICLLLLIAVGFVGSIYAQNVARVGDTEYATLRAAYSAVPSGGTITMIASTTVTGETIGVDKAFTLDLNGDTITSNTSDGSGSLFQIVNGGHVIITDTSAEQNGVITCANKNSSLTLILVYASVNVDKDAKLTIEAGHLESPDNCSKGFCAVSVQTEKSMLVVNGGVLKTTLGQASGVPGVINNAGTTIINGGTIINTSTNSEDATKICIINRRDLYALGGSVISNDKAINCGKNYNSFVLGSGIDIIGSISTYGSRAIDEYVLDDNASLNLTNSLTASKVSYNRGNSNAFGTVCLPFVPDAKATVTYYTLREATESTLTLEQVDSPVANTPYVYYTEDGTFNVCRNASTTLAANPTAGIVEKGDWALNGVYKLILVFDNDDDTGYDANNTGHVLKPNSYYIKDNAFCKGNGYFSVKPFRAYITNQGGAGSSRYDISLFDEATAVSPIAGDGQEVVAIRDLQGVSLGKLQRGVNIVTFADGQTKKVLVK